MNPNTKIALILIGYVLFLLGMVAFRQWDWVKNYYYNQFKPMMKEAWGKKKTKDDWPVYGEGKNE